MIDECGSEAIRLVSLKEYDVLDTGQEAEFDRIVAEAVELMGVPIALISLLDERRQWFKARIGLDVCETSRSSAFCDHTIRNCEVMVVPDAARDARFATNPLVTGAPNIRFYAGAPLKAAAGVRLGSLCVIDRWPRSGVTPLQHRQLEELASRTVAALELRRTRLTPPALAA